MKKIVGTHLSAQSVNFVYPDTKINDLSHTFEENKPVTIIYFDNDY